MKRAILAIVGTVSGLAVLLGFKTHPVPGMAAARPVPAAGGGPDATPTGPASTSSRSSKSTKSRRPATRVVTGETVRTRWGPVQVEVTLTGDRITKVRAIRLPDDNPRDQEINAFAVPRLTRETLSAQSARIDAVSGATYTSEGYIRSLQSALDKAGR